MTFAAPWILALGMVAAAVPVVVHLLTRPRPVRMPLSTLRFVREAVQQRRAAHRLRDFLILALRTLAILLLAAAFAGPRWGEPALIGEDPGDAVRVVVLDTSQSMAAVDGNTTAMQRARSVADRYLQYRRGLRTNLILAGAQPHAVFDNVSTNFEALREELARADAEAQRINVGAALELAARQLAPLNAEDTRRRELVVISDFQRTSWGAATFEGLPRQTKIQLESTAPRDAASNLAILRASCRPLGARHDRLQLEVAIGNYSSTGREATVETQLGDAVYRLSAPCPPQEVTRLTQEVAAPAAGWLWGGVRLVDADDALAADNHRPLAVQLRGQPKYVVITQQSAGRGLNSSQILSLALAPEWQADATSLQLVHVEPSKLDNQSLADADLIAVDHSRKLSADHIGLLARQIRRGRPVLYLASEAVDAGNLDALVKEAQIELPVRLAPPPAGAPRRDLRLAAVDANRSPWATFGDSLPALVEQLRFAGGLSAQQQPAAAGGADDRLRAAYEDGTPALIVANSPSGGSLAVLNMDLAASNVWKTGALVPILDELVQELLATDGGETAYLSGEPLVARIAASGAAESLRILQDNGDFDPEAPRGQLTDDGDATLWQWNAPRVPAVYRVEDQGETVFAAAVALPDEESDLATLPADVVRDRLAAGHEVAFSAQGAALAPQHDLWKWFVVAVVVCLLAEVAALLVLRT